MVLLTLIFVMKSIRILHAAGLVGLIGPSLASLLLCGFSISDYWLVRLFDMIHDDHGQKFAARLRPLIGRVLCHWTVAAAGIVGPLTLCCSTLLALADGLSARC